MYYNKCTIINVLCVVHSATVRQWLQVDKLQVIKLNQTFILLGYHKDAKF